METRDRIDRDAILQACMQKVPGRCAQQRFLDGLACRLGLPPALGVETSKRSAIVRREHLRGKIVALALEPSREAGRRRERDEGREPRILARDLLDHLFDQEMPK